MSPVDALAIETDGLTKRYGETTAVSDLTMDVGGEPSTGFSVRTAREDDHDADTDDADETRQQGRPVSPATRSESARVRYPTSATSPRTPGLRRTHRPGTTRYAAGLRDMPDAEASERIESLLERFDLLADANKRIEDYSKGMRQKVGVIQAVLHEPDVAFLDEPTSGLDPRGPTMRDTIADLADRER